MSEVPLLKLKEQFTCPVCLDVYEDPRSLICQHAFCLKCLDGLLVDTETGTLNCPTCRESTTLPGDGSTADLPPAFQINSMKDAMEDAYEALKQLSTHEVIQEARTDSVQSPAQPADTSKTAFPRCREHDHDMEMFCEKCHKLICAVCGLRAHGDHKYDLVTALYHKHHKVIQTQLDHVKQHINATLNALDVLTTMENEIAQHGEHAKKEIDLLTQKIIETVQQSAERLKENVDEIVEQKKNLLLTQKEEIGKYLEPLLNCDGYVTQMLSNQVQHEVLEEETRMMKWMKGVCGVIKIGKPPRKEGVVLMPNQDIMEQCHNIGSISNVLLSTSSKAVRASGMGLARCTGKGSVVGVVGKRSSFDLHTDIEGSLHCYLHNVESNSVIRCDVSVVKEKVALKKSAFKKSLGKAAKQSPKSTQKHSLFYTPTQAGVHRIVVEVDGVTISSAPSTIRVIPSPRMREQSIREIGEGLSGPSGIAITNDDKMVISEWNSHSIAVCDENGQIIVRFNQPQPKGVAITPDNHIVVVVGSNQVNVFTMDGMPVDSIGSTGKEPLHFMAPWDVAVNKSGYIYVSDTENQRIQVLKPDRSFSSTIGSFGNTAGQFVRPTGITFDSQNMLYVCDSLNSRIQKFTACGEFVAEFGREVLKEPQYITTGPYDMVYVGDGDVNQIVVFDSDGEYLGCITDEGMRPTGVATDSKGNLHICNHDKILVL